MRKCLSRWLVQLVLALIVVAPQAFADSFTLTGVNPSGANLGGVYTGPYIATINGEGGIQVICDDFSTTTYLNQLLNATETKVSDLTGPDPNLIVKFNRDNLATQQTNYMTAAYLALQMLGIDQSTALGRLEAGLLNYAIWGLFTPAAFDVLTASQRSDAMQYLADAQAATLGQEVSAYSHVSIWTPDPNGAAQEFISVSVPEPSEVAVFLFGLLVLAAFARRRHALAG